MEIKSAKELIVHQKAYAPALLIFDATKTLPAEERYAFTSQLRRSSRSVCLNLCGAWAKRGYAAHFISKLTDCLGENAESDTSLDFALDHGFITTAKHQELSALKSIITRADKFLLTL